MKLYYSPAACSLASHIVLRETGAAFELVRVDTQKHTLADGTDFYQLNPKGQVPVLETDQHDLITEGPVIMQFIADLAGASALLAAPGTLARIRVLEWCNHLTSEVHKSFTPLFKGLVSGDAAEVLRGVLKQKLAFVDAQLASNAHLTGESFTIADAYLFVLLGWAPHVKLYIGDLLRLKAFQARVSQRASVKAALKAEGLLA